MATTYQVVTHGLSGELTRAVAAQRLRQMNIDESAVEKLVEHSVVLRKGLNAEQAEAYESKLARAGLSVELREEGGAEKATTGSGFSSKFGGLASKAGSFGEKLKQGVGQKLKKVNIPLGGQTDDDDMIIDEDSSDKKRKMRELERQKAQAQPVKTSGHWRGPPDVEKLFHSEMPRVKMPATLPVSAMKGILLSMILPGIYALVTLYIFTAFLGNNWNIFFGSGAGSMMGFIALFVFLNLFYIILLLFLTKPFIAIRPQSPPVEASRHECPEIFWLIESVCNKLKVEPPEEVYLDMSLDMRITYVEHVKGFFANRTRLIIGAPLTQSLSTAELVGILAHTLAHLRQSLGGRSYFLIRAVNQWLKTSSSENDKLDEYIERQLDKSEITVILDILFNAAQRIFATNKVILDFMFRNNVRLVGSSARAMDFHADQFAAVIIGSDAFEQLGIEYRKVIRAFQQSEGVNDQLMGKNQILQDIPEVVGSLVRGYDTRVETMLQQDIENSLTYPWEPHPADWERIDKANFLQASAIMFCDDTLIDLVPSLHNLGIKATRAYYEHQGLDLSEYQMARPKL